MTVKDKILQGRTYLGIELGSTRIKAVLIDDSFSVIASGSKQWENRFENGCWTYSLDDIHGGIQACYKDLEWFNYWRGFCKDWLLSLNIKEENLRLRDHSPEELCFYSKATTDFEYLFPFGWGELWGVADRTDYDLNQHIKTSGKSLDYFDPETNERYVPYVIEPSLGVERLFLTVVCEAYDEENIGTEEKPDVRTVMRFHPALAPFKACILPLSKKLSEQAGELYAELSKHFLVDYDEAGSIGKRYRRQDEIGTPFCITYDFDSVEDGCVTVRDRDTMEQERIKIDELIAYIEKKIAF